MNLSASFLSALALICAVVGTAQAAPASAAVAAYESGQFETAASIAAESGDAESLVLAARASLAQAITGDRANVDPLITRAMRYAGAALAADPENIEARLQLAVALGMKGRRASAAEAVRQGYARKGRRLIDEAIARDPSEPWAYALLGGWHLEIVRRGGAAGAALYGARVEAGKAAFEKAMRLAPNDGAIAYQYAVALIELDGGRHAKQADSLLSRVRAWAAKDAFETRVRSQALRVQAVLAREGPSAAARIATGRFL